MYAASVKNLSPHRKFVGPATIKSSLRPFYQHAWPKDLPSECPVCGTGFRTGWNLEVEPNRIGRFLRKAARLSFLPCMIGAFIVPLLFDGIFGDWLNQYGGYYFLFMFLTSPVLGAASFLAPIRRHVVCKKCDWNHDYLPGEHTPIPPVNGSR